MNKYNDIEIQTAKNLLEHGYKWLRRSRIGTLYAYKIKPLRNESNYGAQLCTSYVPIFQSVKSCDEPVSLESIVHPQILDDAEKRYLTAMIKPFIDKVKIIKKHSLRNNENILIFYDDTAAGYERYIDLPYFKKGTMYKGMKSGHRYTLEELGL